MLILPVSSASLLLLGPRNNTKPCRTVAGKKEDAAQGRWVSWNMNILQLQQTKSHPCQNPSHPISNPPALLPRLWGPVDPSQLQPLLWWILVSECVVIPAMKCHRPKASSTPSPVPNQGWCQVQLIYAPWPSENIFRYFSGSKFSWSRFQDGPVGPQAPKYLALTRLRVRFSHLSVSRRTRIFPLHL